MQMQHFNHNIWEKHIHSVPSHNSKAAILIFSEALQKLSSLGGSFRQEIQPSSNLFSWKATEQMEGMELEILTTIFLLIRTVTRKCLQDSSISDSKIMVISYLGFSQTQHAWKSFSRSVWISLFLHLLPCSLHSKMPCDEISLLQTQFRTIASLWKWLVIVSSLPLEASVHQRVWEQWGLSVSCLLPRFREHWGCKRCRTSTHPKLT